MESPISLADRSQWITIKHGSAELHFTGSGFVIGERAGDFSSPRRGYFAFARLTRAVGVLFFPLSTGAKAAEVIVASDDPDEPAVIVPLAGTAFLGIEDWMNY
jgi:hypothetical protein